MTTNTAPVRLMSAKEVAVTLGVKPRRVRELVRDGDLRSILFTLSRRMGTSLAMIDATYGHLAPDAEGQERALLDAFDAVQTDQGDARTH